MRLTVSVSVRTWRWLPPVLAAVLAMPPQLRSQNTPVDGVNSTAPARPAAGPLVQSLHLIPLAGNGETNDLEGRVMAPLVVDVLDQNDRPVEGAEVVFRFPVSGPSAIFADKSTSQTVRSNADGQAAAVGWTANSLRGAVRVQVTATRGTDQGSVAITMFNGSRATAQAQAHKSWWSSKWAKIGVIGGAALTAGLIVWATHGGGSGTAAASGVTISATPGSTTIGGPH